METTDNTYRAIVKKLFARWKKYRLREGKIVIRREHLLKDTENVLKKADIQHYDKKWRFCIVPRFDKEDGRGPGVTRDFYSSVARLYAQQEKDGLVARSSDFDAGVFFGTCVMMGCTFGANFSDKLYQTLTGEYQPKTTTRYKLMHNGFQRVLQYCLPDKLLSDFNWMRLKRLLYRSESDVEFVPADDEDQPVVELITEIYATFTEDERTEFKMFTTSEESPSQSIVIQTVNMSEGALPVSHTCAYQLDVPKDIFSEEMSIEQSKQELKRRIMFAIEWCKEFALV